MARSVALIIVIFLLNLPRAWGYRLDLSGSVWNENDLITYQGQSREIKTAVFGGTLGSDLWFTAKKSRHRFGGWYGVGLGQSHVSNKNNDFVFKQSYLTSAWAFAAPGYRYILDVGWAELGVSLPILYRYIDYQAPTTDSVFPNKSRIITNVSAEFIWNFSSQTKFFQRLIIPIEKGVSPVWMFGGGITL